MKNDWIKRNFIKKIKYREVLYKNRRKVEDEGNTLAILVSPYLSFFGP